MMPAARSPRPNSTSACAAVLAVLLLLATFLLISPQPERTFPGSIAWSPHSLLRPLVDAMSLGGWIATTRGVEIKALAFHVAAVAGLVLFALAAGRARRDSLKGEDRRQLWFGAQVLLLGWVAVSAASAWWSGDPQIAWGQAALYLLAVCWTLSLAWTLEARHIRTVLGWLVGVSALGATLCVWYFLERNRSHRPGFPIGNPSTVAASVLPGLIVAGWGALAGLRGWRRAGRAERLGTAAYLLALLPLTACIAITFSRGAVAGLAVAAAAALVLVVGPRGRRILAPVAVAALALGGLWIYQWSLEAGMGRGGSMRFRFYAWQYAAQLWWSRPFLGHGAGAFTRLAGDLGQTDRLVDPEAFAGDWLDHAHNEMFEVLAEIGLVGGVTYVGALIALLMAGVQMWRAASNTIPRWMRLALLSGVIALLTDAMVGVGMRLEGVQAVFYTLVGVLLAAARGVWREQAGAPLQEMLAAYSPAATRGAAAAATLPPPFRGPGAAAHSTAGAAPESEAAPLLLRVGVMGAGLSAAVLCAALTVQNWVGVLAEAEIDPLLSRGEAVEALQSSLFAELTLLTPFRKLAAEERGLQARYALAHESALRVLSEAQGQPSSSSQPGQREQGERALRLARAPYDAALALDRRAPGFGRVLAVQARCAELLAALHGAAEPALAGEWQRRAQTAWLLQRRRDETDPEALLALLHYPISLPEYAANLRNALRAGLPGEGWRAALARVAGLSEFEGAVQRVLAAAAPIDPETDPNSIVVSFAPEAHRLAAYWLAARGANAAAAEAAAQAARLYQPVRQRFGELYSVALAEQAEYTLRADAQAAGKAAALLEQALNALPQVSAQKQAAMALPYQLRLTQALLASGSVQRAEEVAEQAIEGMRGADGATPPGVTRAALLADQYTQLAAMFRRDAQQAERVSRWTDAALQLAPDHFLAWSLRAWLAGRAGDAEQVQAILGASRSAGLSESQVERIRSSLCQEFAGLCDALR